MSWLNWKDATFTCEYCGHVLDINWRTSQAVLRITHGDLSGTLLRRGLTILVLCLDCKTRIFGNIVGGEVPVVSYGIMNRPEPRQVINVHDGRISIRDVDDEKTGGSK